MTRPDPKVALGTLGFKHNYAPKGHQFQNSTSWDVLFSFSAPDTGADRTSVRQKPERLSIGFSSDKSVQEQETGPEQEARHDVQKESKPNTKSGEQKMETEEGAKEVRVMVQAKAGPCPIYKEWHFYPRILPWGSVSWPSKRLSECKTFQALSRTQQAEVIQERGGCTRAIPRDAPQAPAPTVAPAAVPSLNTKVKGSSAQRSRSPKRPCRPSSLPALESQPLLSDGPQSQFPKKNSQPPPNRADLQ